MQTAVLARVLAQHRAAATPKPATPCAPQHGPPRQHKLLAAIVRHRRAQPRTMVEMARDREAVRHPWQ